MNQENNPTTPMSAKSSEENAPDNGKKSFEQLLDETMNAPATDSGKTIVKGTIVRVDNEDVFIDLGVKSEGVISITEFFNKDGEPEVEIGSEVEVLLERNVMDIPKVSKQKADIFKEKEKIDTAYANKEAINARVLQKVKGGLSCDIGNFTTYKAFLPGSQIDIRHIDDFDQFVGQDIPVRIIQMDNNGIVLSRRVILEEEREIKKKETLEKLEEGITLSGKVVKLINQGAFVDIGGIEGFVPVSEISWGKINHPKDIIKEDEELEVKIIKIESESERISLSIKQTITNPWENIGERYKVGSKINGKVVSIVEFGAFVELEPGIEGLIHNSELSWTKNFRHPKEVVTENSEVEVVIIDINKEKRKISLSLKQIQKSPWRQFKEQYPIGTKITGKIKNITELGVFVEVEENIVGLVRPDNIKWEGKVNPLEIYDTSKRNDDIEVVVLNINVKSQRIGLGVKQINEDPWKNINKKYKTNSSIITSKILEINSSGITVEVEDNIKGFYRTRELPGRSADEALSPYKEGDEITGIVSGFDNAKRQINLSVTKLEQKQEKERLENFVSSQGDSSYKLGDILNEKLKSID